MMWKWTIWSKENIPNHPGELDWDWLVDETVAAESRESRERESVCVCVETKSSRAKWYSGRHARSNFCCHHLAPEKVQKRAMTYVLDSVFSGYYQVVNRKALCRALSRWSSSSPCSPIDLSSLSFFSFRFPSPSCSFLKKYLKWVSDLLHASQVSKGKVPLQPSFNSILWQQETARITRKPGLTISHKLD